MKIAFICVGNSARSQIAEALARHHAKKLGIKDIEFFSAGSNPAGSVHPLALKVLEEKGINTQGLKSKHLSEIPLFQLNLVITLCKEEECPYIPAVKVISWAMPDPAKAPPQEAKKMFEDTYKEIEKKVLKLLKEIKKDS